MIRLVLCGLLLTALTACGYRVPGGDTAWVGGAGRSVYVELFANRTVEPYLDSLLTDAVTAELSRSRLVTLSEARDRADLLLAGEVLSFASRTLAYQRDEEKSLYRATLTVTARLVRRSDGVVLWQETLSRSESYPAADDKGVQREAERLAARVAAQRLAEDLAARLHSAF